MKDRGPWGVGSQGEVAPNCPSVLLPGCGTGTRGPSELGGLLMGAQGGERSQGGAWERREPHRESFSYSARPRSSQAKERLENFVPHNWTTARKNTRWLFTRIGNPPAPVLPVDVLIKWIIYLTYADVGLGSLQRRSSPQVGMLSQKHPKVHSGHLSSSLLLAWVPGFWNEDDCHWSVEKTRVWIVENVHVLDACILRPSAQGTVTWAKIQLGAESTRLRSFLRTVTNAHLGHWSTKLAKCSRKGQHEKK